MNRYPRRICSSFSKQNSNTITGVMVDNFFEHRLGKLDVASLSGMGFDCFRRYFCCLNSQHRSLRMEGPIDDFLVLQFDGLLGLDQLWNVALGSSVEVVFKESMTLLVALYQKVRIGHPSVHRCLLAVLTVPCYSLCRLMTPDSSTLCASRSWTDAWSACSWLTSKSPWVRTCPTPRTKSTGSSSC